MQRCQRCGTRMCSYHDKEDKLCYPCQDRGKEIFYFNDKEVYGIPPESVRAVNRMALRY